MTFAGCCERLLSRYEWLRVDVVMSHVFVDGGDQFMRAGEHATTQSSFADVAKEAFDHV
jgi:hypothetical protein